MADTTTTVSGKGEKRKIIFLIIFIIVAIVVAVLWSGLQEVYPHGRCESRFVPSECFGSGGGTSDPFVRDGGGCRETG